LRKGCISVSQKAGVWKFEAAWYWEALPLVTIGALNIGTGKLLIK
jgi:hypothetical protein